MNATTSIVLLALCIGFASGYLFKENEDPTLPYEVSGYPSISHVMHGMTSSLEGKYGDEFDKTFIQEMIIHHEGAVVMAEQALQQAKHQEIKDLAREIINAQTNEISLMQSWLDLWYADQ